MTTIAYRKGILATDTQLTDHDGTYSTCNKLHYFAGTGCFAVAGSVDHEFWFLKWVERGMKYDVKPMNKKKIKHFDALFVDKWGDVYGFYGGIERTPITHEYEAIGNGRQAALTAMKQGATAIEAVKLAGQMDIYTNEIVDYYNARTQKIIRGK